MGFTSLHSRSQAQSRHSSDPWQMLAVMSWRLVPEVPSLRYFKSKILQISTIIESQKRRMVWVGKDLKDHLVSNPHCHGQYHGLNHLCHLTTGRRDMAASTHYHSFLLTDQGVCLFYSCPGLVPKHTNKKVAQQVLSLNYLYHRGTDWPGLGQRRVLLAAGAASQSFLQQPWA